MILLPQKLFFTAGVGIHNDQLMSFEYALRNAGIERCNWVAVSSIFPAGCQVIEKEEGVKLLVPGQMALYVLARGECFGGGASAAVGAAIPHDNSKYGYLSEFHADNLLDISIEERLIQVRKLAADKAEDIARTLYLTKNVPECAGREDLIKEDDPHMRTMKDCLTVNSVSASSMGKAATWCTVIAAAVLLFD